MVGYNEELQIIATEAEAVPKLGNLLQSTTNERLREVFITIVEIYRFAAILSAVTVEVTGFSGWQCE